MDPNLDPSYKRLIEVDWCARLINDSGYRVATISTIPAEDVLMGKTLRTENTIRATLCLYKVHDGQVQETLQLFDIGSGLNGLPGVAHGGITATLLDDACGIFVASLIGPNADTLVQATDKDHRPGIWPDINTATIYLNVTYLGFVRTPSIIAIRSRLKKHQDRKVFVESRLEDKGGNILAKADAMFIKRRRSNL